MRHLLVAALILAAAPLANATPAEETTTLTAPITAPAVAGVRIRAYGKDVSGPFTFTVQGCTSCATATPTWIPDTSTHVQVGVTNSLGPNRTNVSGHAVTVGGASPECSVTPANLRQYVIDAVGAGAGDPIMRAAKQVAATCLGGS